MRMIIPITVIAVFLAGSVAEAQTTPGLGQLAQFALENAVAHAGPLRSSRPGPIWIDTASFSAAFAKAGAPVPQTAFLATGSFRGVAGSKSDAIKCSVISNAKSCEIASNGLYFAADSAVVNPNAATVFISYYFTTRMGPTSSWKALGFVLLQLDFTRVGDEWRAVNRRIALRS